MSTALVPSSARESIEAQIGARWLLYGGILALVVGVSCFVQTAIALDWVTRSAQVLTAAGIAVGLVCAGSHCVRAGYTRFGRVMLGGGVATMYVSTFGAFNV